MTTTPTDPADPSPGPPGAPAEAAASDTAGSGTTASDTTASDATASDTAAELADTMTRAIKRIRRQTGRQLEPYGITPGQARALNTLAHAPGCELPDHPMRLSDLAERLHIAPRSATTVVDALEEAGLVERRPDPADRRAVRILLTEAAAQRSNGSGRSGTRWPRSTSARSVPTSRKCCYECCAPPRPASSQPVHHRGRRPRARRGDAGAVGGAGRSAASGPVPSCPGPAEPGLVGEADHQPHEPHPGDGAEQGAAGGCGLCASGRMSEVAR